MKVYLVISSYVSKIIYQCNYSNKSINANANILNDIIFLRGFFFKYFPISSLNIIKMFVQLVTLFCISYLFSAQA